MSQEIVLYGCSTLRTLRVHWILNELALPYRTVDFGPGDKFSKSKEYYDINLTGKIPSLKIGNIVLTESAAICLYLSERYGNEQIMPEPKTVERAKLYQWCFFAIAELDAHTLYIMLKHGGRLKEEYGESIIAVKAAKEGFEFQIKKVEEELKDGRDFICGGHFTVADILLGTCIESAIKLDIEEPLNVPNHCLRYWKELKNREAYLKALKRNYRMTS